jgi:putative sugar O-methyltransferase
MNTKPGTLQVDDDPELLEKMMNDLSQAPVLYQPTNYWKVYENEFINELRIIGLNDFRRRENSILSRFGATDLNEKRFFDFKNNDNFIRFFRKLPNGLKILSLKDSVINRVLYHIPFYSYFKKHSDFKYANRLGVKYNAGSIKNADASLAGNPSSVMHIGEKNYTPGFLYYYLRYVYCSKFISFNEAEVIMKLHPELVYIIFDIPPQLYVCQQYLKKVFPESVIGYEVTQKFTSFPELKKGMIYVAPSWKFPLISHLDIDLFWNAASFQEMEPDIVANYLGFVSKVSKYIYLQQNMSGKETAIKSGERGVLEPVTLEDYKNNLQGYKLADISPCLMLKSRKLPPGYMDSFWIRK